MPVGDSISRNFSDDKARKGLSFKNGNRLHRSNVTFFVHFSHLDVLRFALNEKGFIVHQQMAFEIV